MRRVPEVLKAQSIESRIAGRKSPLVFACAGEPDIGILLQQTSLELSQMASLDAGECPAIAASGKRIAIRSAGFLMREFGVVQKALDI